MVRVEKSGWQSQGRSRWLPLNHHENRARLQLVHHRARNRQAGQSSTCGGTLSWAARFEPQPWYGKGANRGSAKPLLSIEVGSTRQRWSRWRAASGASGTPKLGRCSGVRGTQRPRCRCEANACGVCWCINAVRRSRRRRGGAALVAKGRFKPVALCRQPPNHAFEGSAHQRCWWVPSSLRSSAPPQRER